MDTRQSLARNADKNSKVSASTSTTTLPGKTDEDGFRVPELKMKRQPRGRGKKTDNSQDQRSNQARKNRRVPISDLDFTSDVDQSPARRYSETQIERDSENEMMNWLASMVNVQTKTLKETFRQDLDKRISDAVKDLDSKMDHKIRNIKTKTNESIRAIDERLATVENAHDQLPEKINYISKKAAELNAKMRQMDEKMEEYKMTMESVTLGNVTDLSGCKQFTHMGENLDCIDQRSLINSAIVTGLNSDCRNKEKVISLVREVLGVNMVKKSHLLEPLESTRMASPSRKLAS